MKYLGFFLLSTLSLLFETTQAKVISLYSGDLSFTVIDKYKEMPISQNGSIGYYSKSGNKTLVLFSYRKSDFDISKVLDGMDANLCNLSNFKLVNTEKEFFWNMTTDYVIKKYESNDGKKFASFTSYVTKGAYCFGFWYNTEEDYNDFEKLIESVSFSEEKGWSQIKLAWKYAKGYKIVLLLLLIIVSFIAGTGGKDDGFAGKVGISLFLTSIVAMLFLIPMWHFWIAYAFLLIVFFVVCFMCASTGSYITFD